MSESDHHRRNPRGMPMGSDYNPNGEELTPQEAADRIHELKRVAAYHCYPGDPETNARNGGRARALAQALRILQRAGIEPDDGAVRLNADEEMVPRAARNGGSNES